MYDAVLVPTDGSEAVQPAIDHGLELASRIDATVHALFVVETAISRAIPEAQWLPYEETLTEAGDRAVAAVEAQASERNIDTVTAVRRGLAHEEIIKYAGSHDIDLVVMGTHGRSGIDRALLGSVTENVIRQTDVPVLVERIAEE